METSDCTMTVYFMSKVLTLDGWDFSYLLTERWQLRLYCRYS